MHEEYKAIVDAGFILQIDDPDLANAWQMYPQMSVAEYRKYQELRIDALNHGVRNLPVDRMRFHMCWGSYHGPHMYDIPLRDIVDLILKVRAGAYSIEASNPCHEHEWRVWQEVKLPDINPRRCRALQRFYRTSAGDRRSSCKFRQGGGKGKRHRGHGLRYRHESGPSTSRLGEIRSDGRRRRLATQRLWAG
jgi:hypothetical protein